MPQRIRAIASTLGYFVPSLLVVVVASLSSHPATLGLLLLADVLTMAAVCHALGFELEASFLRSVLRRGSAHLVLLAAYTAVVMLLLGWPMLWLLREGSLAATLCLSTALVSALLLLWRHWPAFGLVFVWDDAYADPPRGSWIAAAASRSLAFARHLTTSQEMYFSHGLPVGLALLGVVGAAIALAGLCGHLPAEVRVVALAVYALVLTPLANLLIANRSLRALLAARRARHDRPELSTASLGNDDADEPELEADRECAELPSPGLNQIELDAALMHAARNGQVELALAALERGASPDAAPAAGERDQRSVLMLATTLPEVRLLRALIARKADVNRIHAGMTALIAATRDSYQGRPDAVLTLLANGADPACCDSQGNTPLHCAALAADPNVAAMLIDAAAPLDSVNRDGLSPLGVACAAANWPLARFLLERGARNEVEHSQPALLAAASIAEDDVAGVKMLLRHKAHVDATGPLGRTALMAAALSAHPAIVRILLDAGAQVDLADQHGATALIEAARAGAGTVITALIARRAAPNRVDNLGRSALIISCQSRKANPDCARALLAAGADRLLRSRDGKRALDYAVSAGRWDLVQVLDPDYRLPHSVADRAEASVQAGDESPAHLLDALRFGHWDIAGAFGPRLSRWSAAQLAEVWLGLVTQADPKSRLWLHSHGLIADAAVDGTRLMDTLLTGLPGSLSPLQELIAAGASCGGAGLVRAVLECARDCSDDAVLRAGLIDCAHELLRRGADPFAMNAQSESALHLAAQLGAIGLLGDLLERGHDPNARDVRGRCALHAAIGLPPAAAQQAVRLLIRHGANPQVATCDGQTGIGLALTRPTGALQPWLNWPGWPLPGRRLRDSDLLAAAVLGDADAVDKLIQLGVNAESVDAQGASPLQRACGLGHVRVVERLIAAGADVEHAANSGATCLSAAISAHRDAVVSLLISRGVALDRRLPGGGTALMIACALGDPEATTRLLQAGANPDLADEKGNTALHAAAQFAFSHAGSPRARGVIEAMLLHRCAPNPLNAKRQTPLLLLLGGRSEPGDTRDVAQLSSLVSLLLDHAAALDSQDERGVSPLHACAIHGLLGAARQLLARGADRNSRDCLGRSPAELANLLGYADVAAELDAASAMPSIAKILRKPTRPGE